jgi:hypothetical protein
MIAVSDTAFIDEIQAAIAPCPPEPGCVPSAGKTNSGPPYMAAMRDGNLLALDQRQQVRNG